MYIFSVMRTHICYMLHSGSRFGEGQCLSGYVHMYNPYSLHIIKSGGGGRGIQARWGYSPCMKHVMIYMLPVIRSAANAS